jgi:hypothetical protein
MEIGIGSETKATLGARTEATLARVVVDSVVQIDEAACAGSVGVALLVAPTGTAESCPARRTPELKVPSDIGSASSQESALGRSFS